MTVFSMLDFLTCFVIIKSCKKVGLFADFGSFLSMLRFVFLLFLGGCQLCSPVLAQDGLFETRADFAFVMDVDNNTVFLAKNADAPMAPASMSKMMTVALIFEALKAGRLKLDDKVFMSVNAWRTGGAPSRTSAMFVPVKSKVTVEQILRGIIVQSGNDASIAIAEHLSGSEAEFAKAMTAYGKKIGLKQSSFANSTGLPHEGHMMSARDLALLAQHLIKTYPEYYPYFAEKEFKYRRYRFLNRNPLIRLDEGYDGLKTGYTKDSKYGIVASLKRGKRRLIGVFNGLPKRDDRRTEVRRVMEWALTSFVAKDIDVETTKFSARVWGGDKSWVGLVPRTNMQIYVPRDLPAPEIVGEVIYKGPLKAPIRAGVAVAKLRIVVENTVQEVPLFADEPVEEVNFVYRALDSLFYLTFGWIL